MEPFSLHEYARLCVTLRDHEACRVALINSGKEMSAAALDAKLRRDYFWVDVVEKVFNDVNHKPVIPELIGVISNVSAELSPPCFRSGEKLKEHFCKLRSEFSEPLDRWQRSGQGDPDRFPEFLSTARGELTAKSKRLLLFFVVCRCGTPSVNTDFMNMASKVMTCADKRGYEEGCEALDDATAEIPESLSLPTSSGSRKRRRSDDIDLREEMEKVTTAITNLGQKPPSPDIIAIDRIKAQSDLLGLIKTAVNMDHGGLSTRTLPEADVELQEMMKEHYASAKNHLRNLLKDPKE